MSAVSPETRAAQVDCLVIDSDPVIRAMLSACVSSVGFGVQWSARVAPAFTGITTGRFRYRLVVLGPYLDGVDGAQAAERLVASGGTDRVLRIGTGPGAETVDVMEFPIDFSGLFRYLRHTLAPGLGADASKARAEETAAKAAA